MDLDQELARYGPAASYSPASLEEAQAYCRRLANTHYENFSAASRLFPRHLNQHLCNVYAYCRWADDLADESAKGEALALLDWWQRLLDAAYAGEATHPVFVALGETIRQFQLPREPLADLLIAFRRDQTQTRYETLADLLTYCEKSANPVGRIVLHLGRCADEENFQLSDSVCTGLQLANFWQDVRRDYQRGRVYIPQENCRAAGWDEARFIRGRCDDSFRALLKPLVDYAASRLSAGDKLARRVDRSLRLPIRVFTNGGRAILAATRQSGYDVWSRRPTVGPIAKLRILASAVLQSIWWPG